MHLLVLLMLAFCRKNCDFQLGLYKNDEIITCFIAFKINELCIYLAYLVDLFVIFACF